MKKILLILSLCFAGSSAFAAGDPVPGVDVSLEQIPGGIYHTQGDCLKQGGTIVHERGNIFCKNKKIVANTETGDDGSYDFRHQGRNKGNGLRKHDIINGDVKVEK